jgi:hypothetical protein
MAKKGEKAKPRVSRAVAKKSGFNFPGFKETGFQEGDTHLLVSGTIPVDGEIIRMELILAKKARNFGSFLPASICRKDRKIWFFKAENFAGLGFLAMACGEPVIAFVFEGRVQKVRPLADIVSAAPERRPVETARLKHEATEYLRKHGQPKVGTAYTMAEDEADRRFREDLMRRREAERNVKKTVHLLRKSA